MEDNEKRKTLQSMFKEKGIEFILVQFIDINGGPKVKQVPINYLDDIIDEGAGFAGAAAVGLGQGPENHDIMARIDPDTIQQLPWKPNVAIALSNIFVDGKLWPYCCRNNLERMIDLFAKEGYVLNSGWEPEHFLVVRNQDGAIQTWDPLGIDVLKKPCYDFRGISQAMDYLQEIIRYGNQMGFEIYQSDHEDANGQYEINFGWSNSLNAADKLILFRMMAGQVAIKYGAICTFMAKPFEDQTGSGAHLHFHVADVKTGKNLFKLSPGEDDWKGLGVSKTGIYYIGGLL